MEKQNKVLKFQLEQESTNRKEDILSLVSSFMEALGDEKLSFSTWEKIAKVNRTFLDKVKN